MARYNLPKWNTVTTWRRDGERWELLESAGDYAVHYRGPDPALGPTHTVERLTRYPSPISRIEAEARFKYMVSRLANMEPLKARPPIEHVHAQD